MRNTKAQMEIMNLLARNEETVSALYALFSEKFDSKRRFWKTLSQEELIHASWIRKLFPKVEKGKLFFNQDRFKAATIKKSIAYVTKQTSRFKKKGLTLKDAYSVAMEIECTLVESKFFQIYEADSSSLRQLLRALQEAFLGHRAKLEAIMKKKAKKSSEKTHK